MPLWPSTTNSNWLASRLSTTCGVSGSMPQLFGEDVVHERNRDRSLTYRRIDAFDAATAHVADREYAGKAGLEQMRRARQRPVRRGEIGRRQVGTGLDEPF